MSSLVLLLLALVCMPGFTEPWHHPKKAHKGPRAVKAENESNSGSLEGSTEEDAVHAESRLKTRDAYLAPTTTPEPTTPAPTTTQGGKCLITPKQRSVHCLCYRELVGQ